jgi:predicted HicB family RNase H-like nuclease
MTGVAEMRLYNVPEHVHRELKVRAASERTTLNELAIRLLRESLDKAKGRK